jgi:hypothetical protein
LAALSHDETFQVLMKLCVDGNPDQLWERHRPSKQIFDETQISGYQFRNRQHPNLCLDYTKINKKGKKPWTSKNSRIAHAFEYNQK